LIIILWTAHKLTPFYSIEFRLLFTLCGKTINLCGCILYTNRMLQGNTMLSRQNDHTDFDI